MNEPLDPPFAKALIRKIETDGEVVFSRHVEKQMIARDISIPDVLNVLRAGSVDPAELQNGSWRYPVRTARFQVVVAFRSERELVVVTAWRLT